MENLMKLNINHERSVWRCIGVLSTTPLKASPQEIHPAGKKTLSTPLILIRLLRIKSTICVSLNLAKRLINSRKTILCFNCTYLKDFSVWLQNLEISARLETALSHTEKSRKAAYYSQYSTNIKMKL